MGSENNPKTGTDETCRNITVARNSRRTLEPGTERTASWGDLTLAPAVPPIHENQTNDKIKQIK